MSVRFIIRDVFAISGGVTVLACEGASFLNALVPFVGKIQKGDTVHQSVNIVGERKMLNQSVAGEIRAFETLEQVKLSAEDAQSGIWILSVDSRNGAN